MPTLALLAGGQSSRFGGDKARAKIGSRWPLRERVEQLRPAVSELLVIGGDSALAEELHAGYLPDRMQNAGPLAGIQTALAGAATEFVFIFPCDMPRLPVAALELFCKNIGTREALLLRRAGIPVPVCGLYRSALAGPIASALTASIRKITDALPAAGTGFLDVEALTAENFDPDDFLGFNTPEEFASLFPSVR